ncbi:MAG TPA: hypothetical protein DCM05_15180 [Elusimicrobia bacterium]|nr:hypothetical protein [Elusimicrobiota bacterium]
MTLESAVLLAALSLSASAAEGGAPPKDCRDPLCSLGIAAAQTGGSTERGRKLEAMRDELSRLMEEAVPWTQRYEALIKTYFELKDVREAEGEERRIREELWSRYQRMTDIQAEFKKELDIFEAQVLLETAGRLNKPRAGRRDTLKGRTAEPDDSGAKLLLGNSLRSFGGQVQALRERIAKDFVKNEQDYKAVLEAQETRRRWLRRAGGLAALIALFAAAALVLRRRA